MAQLPAGYTALAELGRGANGVVYRARSLRLERTVAIKMMPVHDAETRRRFQREVAALQQLRLPGVVQMLDHGEHAGQLFLVMELVDGEPFPGAIDPGWDTLQPLACALLEIVGAMHRAGVVHRDLKPENVLVRPSGEPVILDLGLARGALLGTTFTATGAIMGTPMYLAPEQLLGQPADRRADLYAVGVMLYEALAGNLPHPARGWDELRMLRLHRDTPTIQQHAPALPAAITSLVDGLLQRDPDRRPQSAEAALTHLRAPYELGWLGPRDALEALIAAVQDRRSVDLWGPHGSGRTHHLRALEAAVVAAGAPVVWLLPSETPLGSLGPLGVPAGGGATAVMDALRAATAAFCAEGGIILSDDWARLDTWSQRLLEAARQQVCLIRVREGADAIKVPQMSLGELAALFSGPERLLHLPSDGAAVLIRRTGGYPGRVAQELRHWHHTQRATPSRAGWSLSRATLDQMLLGDAEHPAVMPLAPALVQQLNLSERAVVDAVRAAWPDATLDILASSQELPAWQVELTLQHLSQLGVLSQEEDRYRLLRDPGWSIDGLHEQAALHRSLAGAHAPGPRRLHHLLRARGGPSLAEEALAEAERQQTVGAQGEAVSVLCEALALLAAPHRALCIRLASLVAVLDDPHLVSQAERALEASGQHDLLQIIRAAQAGRRGDPTHGLALLRGVELPPPLEIVSWRLRWLSARSTPRVEADLLAAAAAWAPDDASRAQVLSWRGLSAYRRRLFTEAAELHQQAARLRSSRIGRLSSTLNAASAYLAASRLADAKGVAEDALRLAEDGRLGRFEARATWVLRAIANRRGATTTDRELTQAASALPLGVHRALLFNTEAMIALRGDAADVAVRLSQAARDDFSALGNRWGALHARAIALAADGPDDPTVGHDVLACPLPEVTLDVLALIGSERLPAAWRPHARAALRALPAGTLDTRHGVYTPRRAAALLTLAP